jgi:hypothetical protein
MKVSARLVITIVAVAVVCFAFSYAGIFNYMKMPAAIQLLLQVVGIAIVVLGISCCGMYQLNKSIDQSYQA